MNDEGNESLSRIYFCVVTNQDDVRVTRHEKPDSNECTREGLSIHVNSCDHLGAAKAYCIKFLFYLDTKTRKPFT
jgi:hypothetical protein